MKRTGKSSIRSAMFIVNNLLEAKAPEWQNAENGGHSLAFFTK
jgi:hypothetical protein